jgi:hypothetical protein
MEEADGGHTKPDFRAKVAIARKESKEAVLPLLDGQTRSRQSYRRSSATLTERDRGDA